MVNRNSALAHLKAGYLFPEIAKRRREFAAAHPDAKIISLGIGDTTEPISPRITEGLVAEAHGLGTREGYAGYQDEGLADLRQAISDLYYGGRFGLDEIIVSDGAKGDIGRLQVLFGADTPIAVQNPTYPVYVDGSVAIGAAGEWDDAAHGYRGVTYLPCNAENDFFPDLSLIPDGSLIYFCSPNNPTGAVASREQLTQLVNYAIAHHCVIIFDAAYSEYVRDPELPKTIYDIPGAETCAIEVNSFSKQIGFTGVRLGWTVAPKELVYADGQPINPDWHRVQATVFNGASVLSQAGGLAALTPAGHEEMKATTEYYLGNAKLIKETLTSLGIESEGGVNSPYVWAKFPGRDSWDVFSDILEKCQIVTTPGGGFGSAGDNYVRFSAFGHREDVQEACNRLRQAL